jgi:hypothetical protein
LILEAVVAFELCMGLVIGEESKGGQPVADVYPHFVPEGRDILSLRGETVWRSKLEETRKYQDMKEWTNKNDAPAVDIYSYGEWAIHLGQK